MNDRLNAIPNRLLSWWKATDPTRRLRLGALVAMGLAALIVGLGFLTRTDWQPVYNNLSPQAAGQITNQLTQMKVPYQLTDQGRTVEVPAAQVDQVRVDLASANIPSAGTVGLPTPMTFTLGETQSEIQINQLIDLEAALSQTIDSIQGVKSSKVLINEPPPSLFGEGPGQASASVFVDLNPGAGLSAGQVRGIMNLVAHSVSGLKLDEVSVVDQLGTVLSAEALAPNPLTSPTGQAGQQLAAEDRVDNAIASQLTSMLNQVLGPGNAVVRVHAALNFDNRVVRQIVYGHRVLKGQTLSVSTSKQAGAAPVRQAGAGGNTPNYGALGATGPSSSSSRRVSSQYAVNQTVSQDTIPAGAVQRMTVAVAVDQTMSPAKLRALKNLVVQAAGLNLKRGDQVSILAQPFNRQLVRQTLAAMAATNRANRLRAQIEAAVAFLALIIVILSIRRLLKGAARRREELAEEREFYLQGAGGGKGVHISMPDFLGAAPEPAGPPSLPEVARKHLEAVSKEEPDGVARVLRTWLSEDE